MKLSDFGARVEQVRELGRATLDTKTRGEATYITWVDTQTFATFRSAALSLLSNLFGERHPYYLDFHKDVTQPRPYDVESGLGILTAVAEELRGGWFVSAHALIAAELFSDFLEMAGHLLDEGYKDAAAVIAGSSLEEHLRQLATRHDVSIARPAASGVPHPKSADAVNADLVAAGVYGKLDQKSVTAWLDLRNNAAHGHYEKYDEAQVRLMCEGIRHFISRVPR